ncbi:septal ring lytic transglycosylase RlpA family protein [Glaciimonas sp. PCH181]|uniref:septal ring lytic transglycosylase RlpA family protein n=1 Tax=Glaciimonas sp. PCH181 TaxID=2133943 RepID=UPI000D397355|nr:septal ring lytic transglycosylase RlpA family protein [Glaciimonas sp. PCH181]PUA18142.1 septal ring lytic transglycosylase RlpA family protein [Glaciimonas sp. PCH181]
MSFSNVRFYSRQQYVKFPVTINWHTLASLPIVALILILAGCSTAPPVAESGASPTAIKSKPSSSARATPVLPPASSGRGGYYKDDGPGDDIPAGLENAADAVPTIEPYARTGNKPYVVFGKTYTPLTDDQPFVQRGVGSWYGKKFHKQRTSSGEPYDMYKMTAAHPTLPIPSYARVTNLKNGKQVIVRVNDRGPFHSSRIIDLSYTAALRLGYLGSGSGQLEVERLLPADILAMNKQASTSPADAPQSFPISTVSMVTSADTRTLDSAIQEANRTEVLSDRSNNAAEREATNTSAVATSRASLAQGYYLQLGAFSRQPNAEMERQRLLQQLPGLLNAVEDVSVGGVYRLYAGPFDTRSAAEDVAIQVRQRLTLAPIIVLK